MKEFINKISIALMVSLSFLSIPLGASEKSIDEDKLIQFPSVLRLKYDFYDAGFGNFIDNTNLIQQLAHTEKTSQEVMQLIDDAYDVYAVVMPKYDTNLALKARPLLEKLLFQNYPMIANQQVSRYLQE